MLENVSAATDLDLISYLKAIPDARMRRGVRIPAWYMLLVAVLGILSRCQSLRDLERFAIRHHSVLSAALGLELWRSPSDSAFRYFFQHVDVAVLCTAIRDWTIAQIPGGAADLDQLICDGKTLRSSIEATVGGGSAFIAQVSLYSAALGVAISQACYATGENHKRAVLRKLLAEPDLEGVLIQANALAYPAVVFSATPGAGSRHLADGLAEGFSEGVGQPEEASPAELQPVPGKAQVPLRGNGSRDQPRPHHDLDPAFHTGTEAHRRALGRYQLDR